MLWPLIPANLSFFNGEKNTKRKERSDLGFPLYPFFQKPPKNERVLPRKKLAETPGNWEVLVLMAAYFESKPESLNFFMW